MPDNSRPLFRQKEQPLTERIRDLLSRLTLEEKVSQMVYSSSAIARLDIPEYNWWNECLHGVGRAGIATVFPQAIALGASFDPDLLKEAANIISDEARAKHHEFARQGDRGIYKGLTFWSPTINIFRDPRWGRGQETYGEDPYLMGQMGMAFVQGLQGDDPCYLKVAACAKHYAVHSGPESLRHGFDAVVSEKDLRETYLPAFRDLVVEAKVEAVMGAYNRTNGEPCCASPTLLQKILREEWGFEGHVVSDCGAIQDIYQHHQVAGSAEEAAALAVNNGCDLNCGTVFFKLLEAAQQGLISEEAIDTSLSRLLRTKFRLGLFDDEEDVPYTSIPFEIVACGEHGQKAREMAQASMVLLKNEGGLLPLDDLQSAAVIGPNAAATEVLLGNYYGTSKQLVTALDGIRDRIGDPSRVHYAQGCDLTTTEAGFWGDSPAAGFAEAVAYAERSDVAIMCMGISPDLEGEEGATANSDGGGDKLGLDLPGMQEDLIKAVHATGTPVVLVLFNGSPVSVNWAQDNVPAIVEAWYPGEEGGNALADILFGDCNPSGRLPVTFVKSLEQLPDFEDYRMEGRTYRYMKEEPLYPFGYGLSYTTFSYSSLKLDSETVSGDQAVQVQIDVENSGSVDGHEVVQLYLRHGDASSSAPIHQLAGVRKVPLAAGETKQVSFTVTPRQLARVSDQGRLVIEPGPMEVFVGGSQPDSRSQFLTGQPVQSAHFMVVGSARELSH